MQQKYIGPAPSVSARAAKLVDALVADAGALRCIVSIGEAGERRVDLGASAQGGIEAGRRLAEICMGGLGAVSLTMSSGMARWPLGITVHSANPVIACLASQYAGWTIQDSATGFFALGSGPARALSRVAGLYKDFRRTRKKKFCSGTKPNQAEPFSSFQNGTRIDPTNYSSCQNSRDLLHHYLIPVIIDDQGILFVL